MRPSVIVFEPINVWISLYYCGSRVPQLIQYGLVLTKFRVELTVTVLWRPADNAPHIRVLIAHRLLYTSLKAFYCYWDKN